MERGNEFSALYDQYKVLVYNLALNYLQQVEDAEEVTQDVFVSVYQSLQQFKNEASPKTWIYRITINKCLDFIKHKKSKKRLFIFGKRVEIENESASLGHLEHPGVLMEHKENAAILFAAINQLAENQKAAFLLSKMDGLSNPEIAAVMETSVSSVESLLFRAKAGLREKLAEKFQNHHKKK